MTRSSTDENFYSMGTSRVLFPWPGPPLMKILFNKYKKGAFLVTRSSIDENFVQYVWEECFSRDPVLHWWKLLFDKYEKGAFYPFTWSSTD